MRLLKRLWCLFFHSDHQEDYDEEDFGNGIFKTRIYCGKCKIYW